MRTVYQALLKHEKDKNPKIKIIEGINTILAEFPDVRARIIPDGKQSPSKDPVIMLLNSDEHTLSSGNLAAAVLQSATTKLFSWIGVKQSLPENLQKLQDAFKVSSLNRFSETINSDREKDLYVKPSDQFLRGMQSEYNYFSALEKITGYLNYHKSVVKDYLGSVFTLTSIPGFASSLDLVLHNAAVRIESVNYYYRTQYANPLLAKVASYRNAIDDLKDQLSDIYQSQESVKELSNQIVALKEMLTQDVRYLPEKILRDHALANRVVMDIQSLYNGVDQRMALEKVASVPQAIASRLLKPNVTQDVLLAEQKTLESTMTQLQMMDAKNPIIDCGIRTAKLVQMQLHDRLSLVQSSAAQTIGSLSKESPEKVVLPQNPQLHDRRSPVLSSAAKTMVSLSNGSAQKAVSTLSLQKQEDSDPDYFSSSVHNFVASGRFKRAAAPSPTASATPQSSVSNSSDDEALSDSEIPMTRPRRG